MFVAAFSLAVGLALGIFLSQGFAVLTASLFEVKLADFQFIFSFSATFKALLYFGIAFVLVIIFNRITIGRQKLIDLLYAERKNEKSRLPHLILSVIVFLSSISCLSLAYYLIEKGEDFVRPEALLLPVSLGVVGTFLFFFSLSGFFLKVLQQNKKVYFKGLNMFVLRQINSKINTAFVSISMICLMLFLSICALSFGMGLSKSLTSDLERLNPFDVVYSVVMGPVASEFNEEDKKILNNINLIEELNRVSTPVDTYAKSIIQVNTPYSAT